VVADSNGDEVVKQVSADGLREVVTDKGYHSCAVVSELTEWGLRTYCSEPNRGPQRWREQEREQQAVYANRRRILGERGLRLLRQRGEKLERWNQHLYDRGGMRGLHLRGRENILKRLVVDSGAANLRLLMRRTVRKGHAARFGRSTGRHSFGCHRFHTPDICTSEAGPEIRRLFGARRDGSDDFRHGMKTASFTSRC
jgi:hypothetical protein